MHAIHIHTLQRSNGARGVIRSEVRTRAQWRCVRRRLRGARVTRKKRTVAATAAYNSAALRDAEPAPNNFATQRVCCHRITHARARTHAQARTHNATDISE